MLSRSRRAEFQRDGARVLEARLVEPRRFLQVVAGPRQVGKTTLVHQVLTSLDRSSVFASADEPALRDAAWLAAQWERARLAAKDAGKNGAVLALDEVQKIPGWSETVKRLWDEDTRHRRPLRAVLLGSAPLLVRSGLSESLAGRFEILHLPHWSFDEMRTAFAAIAAIAVVLAAIGLYGVIAYGVAQRTREIGVRVALGAQAADVARLVLAEGVRFVAVGVVLGVAGAVATSRALRGMLYGVGPADPLTFVATRNTPVWAMSFSTPYR